MKLTNCNAEPDAEPEVEARSACGPAEILLLETPQSADQKSVRARGPQNWNPEAFDQTRCSRTFECRICLEWQRIGRDGSVREKNVRANDPIKTNRMKGTFSLNHLLLGTVRPPELCIRPGARSLFSNKRLLEFCFIHAPGRNKLLRKSFREN